MSSTSGVESASIPVRHSGSAAVSWPLLFGLAGFLIPVLAGWGLSDPDTYWHIAAGQWMLAHGAVLTHDPFSFTKYGAPWIAQEWGAELLIALVYGFSGWGGLIALAAVCFGVTLAYLMRFLLARMQPLHALLFTFLAASMMLPSLLVRPHELVWPLTAVWVGTLVDANEQRGAPPWWLLPIMILWANLHASFVLGLGVAIVLALEAIAEASSNRWSVTRRWFAFLVGAGACALMNPRGYRLLAFPFRVLSMTSLDYIAEWRQVNLQHLQPLTLWLVLILGLAFIGRIRLPLMRNILVLGLLFMALQHIRNVALLGLVTPFLFAKPIATVWSHLPTSGRDAAALDRWMAALARPNRRGSAAVAVMLVALSAGIALHMKRPRPPGYMAPRAALNALLAHGAGRRILNDYGFGGYLIFRRIPVFVDGRADLYGDAFLTRTVNALSLSVGGHLQALLKKYRITGILLRPNWPAVKLLNRLPDWKRIYAGRTAVAYIPRVEGKPT